MPALAIACNLCLPSCPTIRKESPSFLSSKVGWSVSALSLSTSSSSTSAFISLTSNQGVVAAIKCAGLIVAIPANIFSGC